MLSNAYLLAKFHFDTAENEQHFAEFLPKTDTSKLVDPGFAKLARRHDLLQKIADPIGAPAAGPAAGRYGPTSESVGWQNFGKMLLLFGCIGSDFCKKICVLQHFSKSTRFSN